MINTAVCDICGVFGSGTLVSAEDMRKAVFKKGFNPFALGLITNPLTLRNVTFEGWKGIVAQDTSDWNICAGCMPKLGLYLEGKPKPAGVTKATVSTSPLVETLAAKQAELKYKPEEPAAKKYCIYCGFQMRVEGTYCPKCGKRQVDVSR